MVELDPADRLDQVDGAGAVGDERREVEHLEHALEGHERGEHVDPRVRELRERLVDLAHVHGEGGDGAHADGAGDREVAADEVDDRGADGGDEPERDEQHPRVHRGLHADVAHAAGAVGERVRLAGGACRRASRRSAPPTLKRSAMVLFIDALSCMLSRVSALQLGAHPLRRDDEQRQDHERQQREPPLEREHERERHDARTRRSRTPCRGCW